VKPIARVARRRPHTQVVELSESAGGKEGSSSGALYLLDLVPGAIAAFGLRRLRADFGGSGAGGTIRLRRASGGDEESFGTLADGELDLPAVLGFLGGSGGVCAAWYDQSEHGHHAEAIAAGPAFEASPADGRPPMLRFHAPAGLRSPVTLEGLAAFSICAVFRAASVAEATSVARWQKEGDFVVFPYHTAEVLVGRHNSPTDRIPLGISPGNFEVHAVVWRQGAADGFATYCNGSLVMRRAAQNTAITVGNEPLFIGSYAGLSEYFTGDLVELVIWPRALSDEEIRAVSETSDKAAWRLEVNRTLASAPSHVTTESNPSGSLSPAQDADPAGDLAARVRELENQVADLTDTRRRSYVGLHQPLDVQESTYPPHFDPPVIVDGEPLPLPPASLRPGYAPDDDALYLKWGKFDHDLILNIAGRYLDIQRPLRILDLHCLSGRVLRHFETERQWAGWRLHGVDTQARLIEWLRSFWPSAYDVCTTNEAVPVLPFEDNHFDIIYGISVFTHIKYLWDAWLCELRRCLKPGGLCLQTVHCEAAWNVYARGEADWQITGVPDYVRQHPEMDVDYLFFDKSTTSSTFYKRSVVEKMFGRYMPVREVLDPPEYSFQHWVVMQKEGRRPDLNADTLAPLQGALPAPEGGEAGDPDPAAPGPAPVTPAAELDDDRGDEAGLTSRIEFVRGLSNDKIASIGMERVGAEIRAILDAPLFERWPIEKQLPMVERIAEIYYGHQHASGHSLIPAIERVFHRALATPDVKLDTLSLFYDLLYFLYWYIAPDYNAMRGVADQVMQPFAAAIRDGTVRGLPTIVPRALGGAPLRVGYLSQFARGGNAIGPCAHAVLGGLARYLPGAYGLVLYAWSEHDDESMATLADQGITVRRFTANSMSERIAAVAEAVALDEIDILITDMNTALPTVLFERRVAPVQIFFQVTLPFWPLANIDGVFRVEFYDPKLDGFAPELCFNLGLGAWDMPEFATPVEPARIAAERARFPPDGKLIGIYTRFAKITLDFLGILDALLARHPQLTVVVGGTGDGKWIRDFIAGRDLAGRLVLVEEYVDGHVWGHMLDVLLDTFPGEAGVAGREIMAKGKPFVCIGSAFTERERVPMLIADDPSGYADIVSRLIEDRDFYAAACTATRDFVAAQPGQPEYVAAIHDALTTVVSLARSGSHIGRGQDAFAHLAV